MPSSAACREPRSPGRGPQRPRNRIPDTLPPTPYARGRIDTNFPHTTIR